MAPTGVRTDSLGSPGFGISECNLKLLRVLMESDSLHRRSPAPLREPALRAGREQDQGAAAGVPTRTLARKNSICRSPGE